MLRRTAAGKTSSPSFPILEDETTVVTSSKSSSQHGKELRGQLQSWLESQRSKPNYVVVVVLTALITLLVISLSPLSFIRVDTHHIHHHHRRKALRNIKGNEYGNVKLRDAAAFDRFPSDGERIQQQLKFPQSDDSSSSDDSFQQMRGIGDGFMDRDFGGDSSSSDDSHWPLRSGSRNGEVSSNFGREGRRRADSRGHRHEEMWESAANIVLESSSDSSDDGYEERIGREVVGESDADSGELLEMLGLDNNQKPPTLNLKLVGSGDDSDEEDASVIGYGQEWPEPLESLAFKPRMDDFDMVIVYATPVFGNKASDSFIKDDLKTYTCDMIEYDTSRLPPAEEVIVSNVRVLVTADIDTYGAYAQAFVFHGPDVATSSLRERQLEKEVYVFHTMETPLSATGRTDKRLMASMNLLMAYNWNSEIFLPYIGTGTLKQLINTPILTKFEDKYSAFPVAWFSNDCSAPNGRQDYLAELFEYIPAKRFGSCLKNTVKSLSGKDDIAAIFGRYKFVIVFEDSLCEDYITRELEYAIISSTVPVVFSVNGTLPNYDRYLPRHSFINAARFSTPRKLADFLLKVGNDESLYNSYLSYKKDSSAAREKEWQSLWQRFEWRQTSSHWCRAANAVFKHLDSGASNTLRTDDSCLATDYMHKYMSAKPAHNNYIDDDDFADW